MSKTDSGTVSYHIFCVFISVKSSVSADLFKFEHVKPVKL